MVWLCMFNIGTVELREAGGKDSKEIKTGGSGEFLEEKIVDSGRELLCISLWILILIISIYY